MPAPNVVAAYRSQHGFSAAAMAIAGRAKPTAFKSGGTTGRSVNRLNPGLLVSRGGLVPEEKSKDNIHSFDVKSTGFVPFGVGNMIQGTQITNRLGNAVMFRSLALSYELKMAQSTLDNTNIVRVMLFIDHQSNGTTPVPALFLETVDDVLSPYKQGNLQRYTYLYDQLFYLNAPGLAWNGTTEVSSQMSVKFAFQKNLQLKVHYTGNLGTAADISRNNVWFYVFKHNALTVNCQGVLRVRFTDY